MGSIVSRSVRVPSSPPPAMRVLDGIQEEEKTAAAPPRAKIIPLPLNNNHVSSPFLRTDQEQEDAKGTHPPMVVAQVDVRSEERRLSGGGNRGASNPVISASGRSDSGGDRNIGDASIDGPETSTTKNHIPLELFFDVTAASSRVRYHNRRACSLTAFQQRRSLAGEFSPSTTQRNSSVSQ